MLKWTYVGQLGFSGGSDGKESSPNVEKPGFNPWVGKIPWRWKWQPNPVFLPGESQGQKSLVGPSPWGCKELVTTESLSGVQFFATLRTVAHQAPLSMEFSRQEYWSELPFSPPGDLPDPRIKTVYYISCTIDGFFFFFFFYH